MFTPPNLRVAMMMMMMMFVFYGLAILLVAHANG
jgi:Sec-independent protein secretion pathway component TatC